MTRTAAVLLTLAALTALGFLDRDNRPLRGDVAARLLGYVVRVELRVERGTPARPSRSWPVPTDRCVIAADSVTRVVVWR